MVISPDQVEAVDLARYPAQKRKDDIDEEVGAAARDGEDTEGWDWWCG